jgi:D-alanyl-D-alanine carboxypeptidase
MYGAVVERGTVIWQDVDAVAAPWWSLSKTAIASAALVLVQRGRLDLDSLLLGRAFTLRQLLHHAAGLPDYDGLAEYHQAVRSGLPPWSRAEIFERVEVHRLRSTPGTRFLYSNVGYIIARSLIEDSTGLHFSDAMDELVFRPLGLEGVRVALFHGLVISTPSQAALFLNRLLNGELLGETLLQSMREPVMISKSGVPNRPWNSAGYGLGLMIDLHSPLGPRYGHTGEGPGSTTATYRFDALPGGRTVSVFAPVEGQGAVERAALALAKKTFP